MFDLSSVISRFLSKGSAAAAHLAPVAPHGSERTALKVPSRHLHGRSPQIIHSAFIHCIINDACAAETIINMESKHQKTERQRERVSIDANTGAKCTGEVCVGVFRRWRCSKTNGRQKDDVHDEDVNA